MIAQDGSVPSACASAGAERRELASRRSRHTAVVRTGRAATLKRTSAVQVSSIRLCCSTKTNGEKESASNRRSARAWRTVVRPKVLSALSVSASRHSGWGLCRCVPEVKPCLSCLTAESAERLPNAERRRDPSISAKHLLSIARDLVTTWLSRSASAGAMEPGAEQLEHWVAWRVLDCYFACRSPDRDDRWITMANDSRTVVPVIGRDRGGIEGIERSDRR